MALLTFSLPHATPRRPISGFALLARLLAVALFLAAPQPLAGAKPSKEYQLKAVFLFNFASFVEFPPTSFPDPASPFVIGILGQDPFGDYIDEVVRGERIGSRAVEVRRYRNAGEIGRCHVLFVSGATSTGGQGDLEALHRRNILTVGETDEFVRAGGVIGFAVREGKIRLRINLRSASRSGLTISSKLLRVAEIVDGGRT